MTMVIPASAKSPRQPLNDLRWAGPNSDVMVRNLKRKKLYLQSPTREGYSTLNKHREIMDKRITLVEGKFSNLSIKDCPKCKHPVVAVKRPHTGYYDHIDLFIEIAPPFYQCLTCGVKFTCNNECVCKVIEEKLR